MKNLKIFSSIEEKDLDKVLKSLGARTILYGKNQTIFTNIDNTNMIFIIVSGHANILGYDYNGNCSILEKLEKDSIFGDLFFKYDNDISIITTSPCEILVLEFDNLIKNFKNNIILNNFINLCINKIIDLNLRVSILSKRTIREKLLTYFKIMRNKYSSNSFSIPFTYTNLADYLSIDRSAMMRELKKMKDENILKTYGRKITMID